DELKKIRAKTGISILGEGGEYESMTIDSPLFRLPLAIGSSRREWSRSGGTLRVEAASLVPRAGPSDGTS
ncbi:MAG: hypothetical protein J6Z16_02265, partial [Candidatus Methanomethylophilaceae archaeon]|nr:hypothetical protein [Candidatus Methanomethylophilaceae archaeon]